MRVEWTEPALDDMVAIRDYIAEDSTEKAYRFIERLFDAAEPLADQPKMGRHVPEAERQDIRELLYKDYRIIYDKDAVKTKIKEDLREEKWELRDAIRNKGVREETQELNEEEFFEFEETDSTAIE